MHFYTYMSYNTDSMFVIVYCRRVLPLLHDSKSKSYLLWSSLFVEKWNLHFIAHYSRDLKKKHIWTAKERRKKKVQYRRVDLDLYAYPIKPF